MASNSSFYTSSGQTETITANVDELKADAEKLAINPEDEQYTLSDETTTGYSALHYAAKAEEHKDDAETAKTAAETAKTGAETAKTAAEAAYNNIQPNITNINTVAGLSTEITALGASDVSADIQALADSAVLADMDALADIADDISEAATAAGDITTVAHLQDGTDATDAISDLAAIDTDITAVAGKATEIGRLGTADAVADLAALGTAAVVSDLSTVADRDTDIGTVAAADSNIASVAGQISPTNNISTVAGITSDISAVAGKATEIGRLGTADAVADLAALGTASMVADLATVADRDADIATVASRDADIATVADRDADIGTVADRDADIGTLASNNANITTVASNISGVNSFAERYRTGTTDPTTDNDEGDLFYNQTTDDLKVWTGSAWEAGVTAGSGFLATSGGTMTGALTLSGAPTANLHAATKQYVDDNSSSGISVKYANFYASEADKHVSVTASSPTTIDVDLFDDGIRIASTDSFSGTTNGFSFTTAATAATQNSNTSGYVITNTSGADIDLSGYKLKIKMTVSNLTTTGTLRLEGGTAIGNSSYFFVNAVSQTDPTANGAFEISDDGTGTLANNASMYIALRVYDGNNSGDMDYDITIDSIHLFPKQRGSEDNIATAAGYVGFGSTHTSETSLVGFNDTDSSTATDYDWNQLLVQTAFGGGTDGQVVAVDSAGTGLEWITPLKGTYIGVNSTGGAASVSGTDAIGIGENVTATGNIAVAIGSSADATNSHAIALGFNTQATGSGAVGIGRQGQSTAQFSTALGALANAGHQSSTALGTGATTTAANQLMLGGTGSGYELTSIRVGNTSYAPSDDYDLATKKYVDDNAGGSATGNTFVAYAIGEPAQDYVEEDGVHSRGVNNGTQYTLDFTSYTYHGSNAFSDHAGWDGFADGDYSTGAATTVGHTNTYADALAYIQNDTGSNIVLDDSNVLFRDGWAFYNGSSGHAATGDKVDFIITTNGTTDNSADYLYKITFTQNGSNWTTWTNSRVTNLKNYTWNNGTKLYCFFKKNGSFSAAGTIYGMSPAVNWNFSSETEEYVKELVANSFSYTKNTYNSAAVTHTWYGISTKSTQPSDNATGYAEFDWHEIDPADPPSFDFLKSHDTAASTASGNDSIALGARAVASGYDDISIGADSDAVAGRGVVIGTDAQAYSGASYSVSIGKSAKARNTNNTAVGGNADVGGNHSTAIGAYAKTNISGSYATAIGGGSYDGDGATVTGNNSTALGASTYINGHTGSIAIGYNAATTANNQMMLGTGSGTGALTSIRVANSSYDPSNDYDLATKKYVDDNGGGGFDYGAVNSDGTTPTATGLDSIAIGESAVATNDGDVCIGLNAHTDSNSNNYSVAIGKDANCVEGYGVAVGVGADAGGISGAWGATAVGAYADATTSKSVGIGYFARATNSFTVAIGDSAQASQSNATALGRSSIANGSQSTSIGSASSSGGYSNSASLGYQATSNANNTVTLGNSSITSLRCQDTTISAVSDYRDKTQIEDLSIGLDYVNSISPKAYYKNNRANYYDDETNEFDQSSYDAATQKHDKREFGFIAQDVAAELPAEYADARVSFAETEAIHGYEVQRFAPADMLPILWKAVQELSAKNEALEARITALENA